MLNDIFRTSDEDTRDEEEEDQDANLRKLSSGLTIRPVDSSEEPKPKYVKQLKSPNRLCATEA